MYTKTFLLAALASIANGHLVITSPMPYGAGTLNNSPLDGTGADFPCKLRTGVYEAGGAKNAFKQGSTQKLALKGTTVHAGGSCQISVTTDLEPDKDSVWKVIKSIEGGCPAKGQTGNLPGENPDTPVPYTYEYTIPEDLPAGKYTLAWTWLNKSGGVREMYMNCAPLEVEGTAGSDTLLESLPDMFVANIGGDCGTQENTDVEYPDPGDDVDRFNGATDAFAPPTGACAAGGGGGNNPAPTTTKAPGGPVPTETQPPVTQPPVPTTPPGGIFITKTTSGGGNGGPQPTYTQPTEPQPTGGPDGPGGGYAAGTPCTSEGAWNCLGGTSFQRCASGAWSVVQNLSAGDSCKEGESAMLNMSTRKGKRAMRHALRNALV